MRFLNEDFRKFAGFPGRLREPQGGFLGIDTIAVQSRQSLAVGEDAPSIGELDDCELGEMGFHVWLLTFSFEVLTPPPRPTKQTFGGA